MYSLRSRSGSALAWHTHGRVFTPRLLPEIMRFVARIYTVQVEHKELPCEGWGATAMGLYPPFRMPLSVASCGRLQLGAAYWATSVALLQVVDN